jgi:hypothetical protein
MRPISVLSTAFLGLVIWTAPAAAQTAAQPGSPAVTPTITRGEAGPASAYVWGGLWFSNHYLGGYVGGLKSLNETGDLWSDGWVLRADASGGRYTYSNLPGFRNIDVGTLDSDIMIGYRTKAAKGTFAFYAGPSYAFHQNPDPAADLRGTEFGAKFLAEYSGPLSDDLEGYAQASYNTSYSTYSMAGRVLHRFSDNVWAGGQATLYGNKAPYTESTFGPYVKIITSFGEVGISGGYRHVYTSGGSDGYFASIYVGLPLE